MLNEVCHRSNSLHTLILLDLWNLKIKNIISKEHSEMSKNLGLLFVQFCASSLSKHGYLRILTIGGEVNRICFVS